MELSEPPTRNADLASVFGLDDDEFDEKAPIQTTKNTFIHYSIPADEPPVNTAPGACLPRVFKTKPKSEDKASNSAGGEVTASSEVATAETSAAVTADVVADGAAEKPDAAPVERSADAAGHAGSEEHQSLADTGANTEVDAMQPAPVRPKCPTVSMGSGLHDKGGCSPCAWYWKAEGCSKGPGCTRCHLCPPGELKRRKKAKTPGNNPSMATVSMDPVYAPDPPRPPAYSEPAYVVTQDAPAPWDSQASVDILPTKVSFDLRVKNTFLEVDSPSSKSMGDCGPPTASAPGQMLSRLFRTTKTVTDVASRSAAAPSNSSLTVEAATASATTVASGGLAAGDAAAGADADTAGVVNDAAASRQPRQSGESQEALHERKECTPCNYYWYKADGCRQGSGCEFCHLCPKGEIKRRKKEKVKMLKAAGQALQSGLRAELGSSAIAAN